MKLQRQTEDFYERFLEVLEDERNDKIYETFRKPKHLKRNQVPSRYNDLASGYPQIVKDITCLHEHEGSRLSKNNELVHVKYQKSKENVYSNEAVLEYRSNPSNHSRAFDNDSYACFDFCSQSSNLSSVTFNGDPFSSRSVRSHDSQQLEMAADSPGTFTRPSTVSSPNSCYESLAETRSEDIEMFLPKCSKEMHLMWSISNDFQVDSEADEPLFSHSTINSMNSLLHLSCLKPASGMKRFITSNSTKFEDSVEPYENIVSPPNVESEKQYQNVQDFCLKLASSKLDRGVTNRCFYAETSIDGSECLMDFNDSRIDKADESLSLSDYSLECLDIYGRHSGKEKSDLYFDDYFHRRYRGNPNPSEPDRRSRINKKWERNVKAGLSKPHEAILDTSPETFFDKKHPLKVESPEHEMQSQTFSRWDDIDSSSTVSTIRSCPDITSADESVEPLYDQILSDCVFNNYKLSQTDASPMFENYETDFAEVFCKVKIEDIQRHPTANWNSMDTNFSNNIYINET